MGDKDDYGNLLSDSLNNVNVNTNSNSLFSDNQKALTGLTSGNNESVFDQNTVIDLAGQKNLGNNSDFIDLNNPAGNVSKNYVQSDPYTVDASGKITGLTSLNDIKKFIADNKGLFGLAAAGAGAMSQGAQYGKTGYQGSIPQLLATRNMVTAPPKTGYRPGAGGINYGGDVSYTELPKDSKLWSQLTGNSGTTNNANLTKTDTTAGQNTGITKLVDNKNTNTVKTADLIPYFKLNPDVAASYAKNSYGMTPEAFANFHWQNYGKNEQRVSPDGVTPEVLNSNIIKWINDNPNASASDITAIMKKSGVNTQDIARALAGDNTMSAGKEYAILNNMGLDTLSKNILTEQAQGYTPEQKAALLEKAGLTQADVDAANKYSADTGYKGIVQAAVPTNNMEDSIRALIAQQKAIDTSAENNAVKADNVVDTTANLNADLVNSLENLGLNAQDLVTQTPVDKSEATNYLEPYYDNTDYSYMQFAEGGMAEGRYLQGGTDGMADEIPARIGKDQPAALSHGEFVIPADVVSHMGNGNSDAGAKKLYQMMDKIRMARTGNKKQGKKINPDKFMPGGLAAAYAAGGKVKHFDGSATSLVTANNTAASNPGIAGVESNLSNWAGDYVTNMLGQGQALANMPYQAYMGPLTAGESPLQTNAFNAAKNLTTPASIGNAATTAGNIATKASDLTYKPTTSSFDAAQAQTYMNPYLQASLNPQLEEARRQSQITQTQNAGKMTQAGAFGGGRQAILDAETQRALGANLANITGSGYNTAYDKAMAQFNADQARKAQENQFGATYGLQGLQTGLQAAQAQGGLGATQASTGLANLSQQLAAGQQQRAIESEGIAADKAQFEEARANPYKMVQFQQSLLQGLPLDAKSYQGIEQSDIVKAAQGATTVNQLLKNLGLIT